MGIHSVIRIGKPGWGIITIVSSLESLPAAPSFPPAAAEAAEAAAPTAGDAKSNTAVVRGQRLIIL